MNELVPFEEDADKSLPRSKTVLIFCSIAFFIGYVL